MPNEKSPTRTRAPEDAQTADLRELIPYLIIALVALAIRLAKLSLWPLLPSEAETALAAWRALGSRTGASGDYVPLLYAFDLIVAGLFRASDAAIRLSSALAGAGLVLVPWFLRERLGRKGSLAASFMLALSPTMVHASRTADGAILAALSVAACLTSLDRYLRERRAVSLSWAGVWLVLGLMSGPALLTPFLLALLPFVWWRLGKKVSDDKPSAVRETLQAVAEGFRERSAYLPAVVVLLIVGTAALSNLGGLGATVELQWRWFADLIPKASGLTWYHLLRNLGIYEYLIMALALVGLISGLLRKDKLDAALGIWFAVCLVLSGLLGHRDPYWMLDALLPALALAARGVQWLWDELVVDVEWRDGAALWLAFCLGWFALFSLAAWTHSGQERFLTQARIGLGVLILGWAGYWYWAQRFAAMRLMAALLLVLMTIGTVRTTTAMAYQTGRDPREPLVVEPTSTEVSDLAAFVSDYSSRKAGDPHELTVAYEQDLDPLIGWYLRDMVRLDQVGDALLRSTQGALVARERTDETHPAGYAGQRFRLHERWPEQQLSTRERLRWFMFRDAVGWIESETVRVWVRLDY